MVPHHSGTEPTCTAPVLKGIPCGQLSKIKGQRFEDLARYLSNLNNLVIPCHSQ